MRAYLFFLLSTADRKLYYNEEDGVDEVRENKSFLFMPHQIWLVGVFIWQSLIYSHLRAEDLRESVEKLNN